MVVYVAVTKVVVEVDVAVVIVVVTVEVLVAVVVTPVFSFATHTADLSTPGQK